MRNFGLYMNNPKVLFFNGYYNYEKHKKLWKRLSAGTVPVYKKHLTGTVPANKEHLKVTLYIFWGNEGEMLIAIF